ncbi:MAG: hypothetical protein KDD45_01525 [Bdellovibrionales bacterium]|nr:hypothetical protein [Bdellovibrionales bacterium]
MSFIGDLFKGMIFLSMLAVLQNGCTVKNMANKAVEAHKIGLTNYGTYSRMLTGHGGSWVKKK